MILKYVLFMNYLQKFISKHYHEEIVEKIKKYKLLIKFILIIISFTFLSNKKVKEIKIAICTIGKKENLYVKEYILYFLAFNFYIDINSILWRYYIIYGYLS